MDIKVYYDNYEKLKYACEYSEQKLLMAKEQLTRILLVMSNIICGLTMKQVSGTFKRGNIQV